MSGKQCPCCRRKRVGPVKEWRRNSQYVDESLNYLTAYIALQKTISNTHISGQIITMDQELVVTHTIQSLKPFDGGLGEQCK